MLEQIIKCLNTDRINEHFITQNTWYLSFPGEFVYNIFSCMVFISCTPLGSKEQSRSTYKVNSYTEMILISTSLRNSIKNKQMLEVLF